MVPPLLVPSSFNVIAIKCVPGETVTVRGKETHSLVIPAHSKDGERLWFEFEGGWIDFTVRKDG